MSAANEGVRLGRLLPVRELAPLVAAFAPLVPGATWRVRDASGRLLVEHGGVAERADGGADAASAAAPTVRAPLRFGDHALGELELRLSGAAPGGGPASTAADGGPAPAAGPALGERALAALRATLEAAIAAGAVRRELANETLERYREVHLAYRLSERLAVGVDVEALPAQLLEEALRVVDAPVALLVLGSAVVAAVGVDPLGAALGPLVDGVRARADGRASIDTAPLAPGVDPTGSCAVRLWAPLRVGEAELGGVLLGRPDGAAEFSAGDAKLLAALATQAATILEHARMHAAALAQARLARELQLAHEVQARLMPSVLPDGDGWELAAWWSAAREVAGDFYDATRAGGVTSVTVGDVADKGMAAALFMALTRSVLRASAGDGRRPGEVVTRANALLCADASDGMFVTLAHAQLGADGTVRYANAGHNPPLVVRADGAVEALARTGILVGWDEGASYADAEVVLAPGDALVVYTDGIPEARDAAGAEYGEARLVALVRDHVRAGADAGRLLAALRADLAAFVGDAEAFDDATVLVARRETASPPSTPPTGP